MISGCYHFDRKLDTSEIVMEMESCKFRAESAHIEYGTDVHYGFTSGNCLLRQIRKIAAVCGGRNVYRKLQLLCMQICLTSRFCDKADSTP